MDHDRVECEEVVYWGNSEKGIGLTCLLIVEPTMGYGDYSATVNGAIQSAADLLDGMFAMGRKE